MRAVTKDEFYAVIGGLDVTPYPDGAWPYTMKFKTRSGVVVGQTECDPVGGGTKGWYLP